MLHKRIPFRKGSLNSYSCYYAPTPPRYFSTVICISRVIDGGVLRAAYCFLADSELRIRLRERELLLKDLFFEGVSKFLNLQRYISL